MVLRDVALFIITAVSAGRETHSNGIQNVFFYELLTERFFGEPKMVVRGIAGKNPLLKLLFLGVCGGKAFSSLCEGRRSSINEALKCTNIYNVIMFSF